jgi:hypothetical protein
MLKFIRKMKRKYWCPTPKTWRKIGDALLGVSTMGVPAVLMNYPWVGITLFMVGIIGKFLTNFFSNDETI